jgi:hypothetical protein
MGLDLCLLLAATGLTSSRGCDPRTARVACVEDVGFVSGNEERTCAVPHRRGISFSAAIGT